MSLPLLQPRPWLRLRLPTVTTTTACARCFSSSRSVSDVFQILSPSAPAAAAAPRASQSLATRMADQTLVDVATHARAVEETARRTSYQKQMARAWNAGDVYAPHDLTGAEQNKWKMSRKTPQSDAFDRLGIDPVTEYKNFTLMSEYMTEMGRIKHSRETGLRPKNQRKVAKAIRRAIGLGLMPSVHRHPLVLRKSSPIRFQ